MIWGFHGEKWLDICLGQDTMYSGGWLPTCWRNHLEENETGMQLSLYLFILKCIIKLFHCMQTYLIQMWGIYLEYQIKRKWGTCS